MNTRIQNRFLVDKSDLSKTTFSESPIPELKKGEVLLKIDKYGFTTNNITYAVAAPKLNYWDFFPASDNWGVIPTWGFASVEVSQHEEIKEGERYYGYYPMSDYLIVQAGKITTSGFIDSASHRQALAPIYNHYMKSSIDFGFLPELENFYPIIRPLFATSFLNYYFLKEANFFDAASIVLTSASSKTALALAFMLKQNQKKDGKKIIGITSPRNFSFVKERGFYDQVIVYDDVINTLPKEAITIVDLAGNASLLKNIYENLGDQLKYISLIGITDWQSEKDFKTIPRARFFFAPSHIEKRVEEWGAREMAIRLNESLHQFIKDAAKWMEFQLINDQKTLDTLFHANKKTMSACRI